MCNVKDYIFNLFKYKQFKPNCFNCKYLNAYWFREDKIVIHCSAHGEIEIENDHYCDKYFPHSLDVLF